MKITAEQKFNRWGLILWPEAIGGFFMALCSGPYRPSGELLTIQTIDDEDGVAIADGDMSRVDKYVCALTNPKGAFVTAGPINLKSENEGSYYNPAGDVFLEVRGVNLRGKVSFLPSELMPSPAASSDPYHKSSKPVDVEITGDWL